MPEMSGLEAVTEIRKFNKKVPIIAQSAHAFEYDRKNAFEAGCSDYISKPVNRSELISMIRKHMNNNAT